jgi:SAM-dependent methyltransferase
MTEKETEREAFKIYYRDVRKPSKYLVEVSKLFKKEKVSKVLDFCCGNGRNSFYLARAGFDVYGLDWSRNGVAQARMEARRRKLKVRFVVRDALKPLSYGNGKFDAVIAVRSMYHGRISQLRRAVKEVARVTKPGGYLYWRVASFENLRELRDDLKQPLEKLEPDTYRAMSGPYRGNVRHYFSQKAAMEFLRPYYKIKSVKSNARDFDIVAQRR